MTSRSDTSILPPFHEFGFQLADLARETYSVKLLSRFSFTIVAIVYHGTPPDPTTQKIHGEEVFTSRKGFLGPILIAAFHGLQISNSRNAYALA